MIIGALAGVCTILATLWAIMRLLAPLRSLEVVLTRVDTRLVGAELAAKRAVRAANAAKREAACLHDRVIEIGASVDVANAALADIQSRSYNVRSDDRHPRAHRS